MRHRFMLLAIIIIVFAAVGFAEKHEFIFALYGAAAGNGCSYADALKAENAALRNQIAAYAGSITPANNGIIARIYASYPFNDQKAVVVDKGSNHAIRSLMPATIGGVVLVGQVTKIFVNHSIVRTIASSDWQIPVRIGPRKVPGLFVGGFAPRITMIPNEKAIAIGDEIIAASQDLPYGLAVGTVESFRTDAQAGIFQEAAVALGYDAHSLTELTLLPWTPD